MSWDPSSLPIRPGVYTRFRDLAMRNPQGGPRGIVAIPLLSYGESAEAKKFYTIERVTEANELFGPENIDSIRDILEGGANQVLVYTMPEAPVDTDYDDMLEAFMTRDFNVFVFDQDDDAANQSKVVTWLGDMRAEDRHVLAVFGGSAADDADPTVGNTRSSTLEDAYSVNLIVGTVTISDELSSAETAPYLAGLIAGLPLNDTATYKRVRGTDVTKRLKNSEINTAIEAGSLVLINDGANVKIEKGVTTTGDNIRSIRARQTILNDLPRILKDEVVARLDNSEDGRQSVVSLIKRYLETLANENIISSDPGQEPTAYVDPENPPHEDAAFFVVEYTDVFSMERVFLTVNRLG